MFYLILLCLLICLPTILAIIFFITFAIICIRGDKKREEENKGKAYKVKIVE